MSGVNPKSKICPSSFSNAVGVVSTYSLRYFFFVAIDTFGNVECPSTSSNQITEPVCTLLKIALKSKEYLLELDIVAIVNLKLIKLLTSYTYKNDNL